MGQLRIGVIGVSGRGGMAQNWHDPKGRSILVAGADVNDKYLKQFSETYEGKVYTTTDYTELLKRDDIDAVGVFSPDFCHEEQAIAALEAGKHVFCEKPLAITVEGCDRILRAWKASGKKFLMGFNMRYMNMVRVMKQVVDDGVIGEIKAVWVRHFVPSGGDWYFHDWHATRQNATSLLLQKASHDIDVVHWITGSYGKRVVGMGGQYFFGGDKPNDLTCDACDERNTCTDVQRKGHSRQQCCFRKEVDQEDVNHILWELQTGIQCSYMQCHFAPRSGRSRNYVFHGTEGAVENVVKDGHEHIMVHTRKSGTWKDYADRDYVVKRAEGGHGGADPVICGEFLDYVLDDAKTTARPIDGRHSVAVGCAGAESIRNGSMPVDVVPVPDDLADLV